MGATMKAAVLMAPGKLEVRDIPVPVIGADELLIRVAACGICGSDLRYFDGENPWALHTLGVPKPNPPGMVLGHEFGGVVVAAGSPALADWIGARVAVAPYDTTGTCRMCRTGRPHLCPDTIHIGHATGWGEQEYYPGAMAEYCRAWARRCYRIPDDYPFDEVALFDIAGVAYHAIERGKVGPGATVLIMGLGPLGMTAARLALLRGARAVYCVDLYERSLRMIEEPGIRGFLASDADWPGHVAELTDGWGVDAVIDTVGQPATLDAGRRALAPGGVQVMLAVHTDPIGFPTTELGRERTLCSSSNYRFEDLQATIDLAVSGRLRLDDLVTHRVALADVNRGFDILRDKERTGAIKVLVVPESD